MQCAWKEVERRNFDVVHKIQHFKAQLKINSGVFLGASLKWIYSIPFLS